MSVHLKNKNVFITGASSGIGKACATAFAREGSNVLLAARRKERIDTLARELESTYGIMAHSIQLDVRNNDEVTGAVGSLPPAWNTIDILLNNASHRRTGESCRRHFTVAVDRAEHWTVRDAARF